MGLPAAEVQRIKETIAPYQFERVVAHSAHDAVLRSAERYMRALEAVRR